jgi:hypothetical protein
MFIPGCNPCTGRASQGYNWFSCRVCHTTLWKSSDAEKNPTSAGWCVKVYYGQHILLTLDTAHLPWWTCELSTRVCILQITMQHFKNPSVRLSPIQTFSQCRINKNFHCKSHTRHFCWCHCSCYHRYCPILIAFLQLPTVKISQHGLPLPHIKQSE